MPILKDELKKDDEHLSGKVSALVVKEDPMELQLPVIKHVPCDEIEDASSVGVDAAFAQSSVETSRST
eukprot:7716275-Prorocentrum_lima.AAC.1